MNSYVYPSMLANGYHPSEDKHNLKGGTNNLIGQGFGVMLRPEGRKPYTGMRSGSMAYWLAESEGEPGMPQAYLRSYDTVIAIHWGEFILVDGRTFSVTTTAHTNEIRAPYAETIRLSGQMIGAPVKEWITDALEEARDCWDKLARARASHRIFGLMCQGEERCSTAEFLAARFGVPIPNSHKPEHLLDTRTQEMLTSKLVKARLEGVRGINNVTPRWLPTP